MPENQDHPCRSYSMLPIKGSGLAVDTSALGGDLPSGDWEQKLEDNGWVKFPNGLILQWGCYTGNKMGMVSVPFEKQFAQRAFTAVATFLNADGNADIGVPELDVDHMVVNVDTGKVGVLNFRWIALGL